MDKKKKNIYNIFPVLNTAAGWRKFGLLQEVKVHYCNNSDSLIPCKFAYDTITIIPIITGAGFQLFSRISKILPKTCRCYRASECLWRCPCANWLQCSRWWITLLCGMGSPCWKTLDTSEFWTCLKVRLNLSQTLRKVKIRNARFEKEWGGGKCRVHFWVHSTQTCTSILVCVFKVFCKNGMSLCTVFIYFSTHTFETNLFQAENVMMLMLVVSLKPYCLLK